MIISTPDFCIVCAILSQQSHLPLDEFLTALHKVVLKQFIDRENLSKDTW